MKILILIIALIAAVLDKGTFDPIPSCAQWAQEMSAEPDDWRLHYMGCVDPYGYWVADDTPCMQAAREAALIGLQGAEYNVFVGSHSCVLYEDGTWGAE